jgi:hypothetical protein
MDDDEIDHPVLGLLRRRDGVWLGRSDPGPDFHDLVIVPPAAGAWDPPPASALEKLAQAQDDIDTLKDAAVSAICAARQARLNWRAGPPVADWSIIEARIDPAGALWLTLNEYETDEYSAWAVLLDASGAASAIRRRPFTPYNGAPGDAGVLV